MAAGRFRQFRLLMWKNWLFSIRSWKSTFLQLLAPCIFLVLATGLSYLPQGFEDIPHPPSTQVGLLPKCTEWNGMKCTSLVIITPNDTKTSSCVQSIVKDFSNVTGLKNGKDILMYDFPPINISNPNINITEYEKLLKNLTDQLLVQFRNNRTQAGVAFLQCDFQAEPPSLTYAILYNSSRALRIQQLVFGSPNKPDGRVELAILIDQLFMRQVTGKDVNITVNVSTFPRFYQERSRELGLASSATLFIFCAITIQFVMLVYNVVSEKDLKLRQGLKLVGLKDSVYWFSWAVTGIIISFLSTCVLMATGYACQLQFFFNTNFFINFMLFLMYSVSMVPLAFFTSVFISTIRAAVNCGMVVFVVGMIVVSMLSNQFLLVQLYENVKPLVLLLSLLPPFHLAKAMADIGAASSNTDMNGLPQEPYHFGVHQLFQKRNVTVFGFDNSQGNISLSYFEMPRTVESYGGLLLTALLYGLLSWYLDAVLRGNHGIPRKWYFFIYPSYWLDWFPGYYSNRTRLSGQRSPGGRDTVQITDSNDEEGERDEESSNESTSLLQNERVYGSNRGEALRIEGLRKEFHDCCMCSRKAPAPPAVDGLTLAAEEHQVLALLGHNGAGKTTTINMLIGLLQPDMGDAYFYNLSVRENLDAIRDMLGVCPQHDVLWGDLTAMEHMQLFGNLKDIPREVMENEIETLLKEVQLDKVAKNYVKTFSGGMKRRLSVALSFLGDPKVMFLDEPTTGMDPKIRRHIWNLILRMKENRVTIMTTHSMEEADILGDNIAIMANGQLKVMGTSVSLKNKFAGYMVDVIVREDYVGQMIDLVTKHLPGAMQKSEPIPVEGGGVLLPFALPPDRHDGVVPFFKILEKDEAVMDMVLDYSISQTTLEEVFLNVTMNELFRDVHYVPTLMKSCSYTATSPTDPVTSKPFPDSASSTLQIQT